MVKYRFVAYVGDVKHSEVSFECRTEDEVKQFTLQTANRLFSVREGLPVSVMAHSLDSGKKICCIQLSMT